MRSSDSNTGGTSAMQQPRQSNRNEPPPGDAVAKLDRIYDLRRNCLLNELYYAHRLNFFTRMNLWLDAVIVIGSGASGVSGWVIWTTYPELKVIWAVVAATATLLAALKPVLHVDAQVKRYSVLFASYRQLSISMAAAIEEIIETRGVSPQVERDVNRVRTRYASLAGDDDPKPSKKLVRRLQSEVNSRIPVGSLFYPGSTNTPRPQTGDRGLTSDTEACGVCEVEPRPTAAET
jgi:hypothetical protein